VTIDFFDPGRHAEAIAALDPDLGRLTEVVRGLLLHDGYIAAYGLDPADCGEISRTTLPVAERLDALRSKDSAPLSKPRPAAQRAIGTCRDYALLLAAFLRLHGVSARLRCGFADYFSGPWEDHWVTEYWRDGAWHLADAQLDAIQQPLLGIDFDTLDMPRARFRTAAEAWLAVDGGGVAAESFGHGDNCGLWFIQVNLERDRLALADSITSSWDGWRETPPEKREDRAVDRLRCERLAAAGAATASKAPTA